MSLRGNNTVFTASSLAPGTQLNGTYEIAELISSGGMGEVYRGHNIGTGDPVAIKVVLPEYAADQFILELFRKEARILNQLAHEAIVRYYNFATDRTINRSYMAMEFVDGPSLAHQMKKAPLTVEEVSGLRIRLADGLQKAHELGVIHRDISPENVILQGGLVARAKIIDFGIAKSTALTAEGGTLIGTTFAGRYNYASPEQVGMFRSAGVSPRSDIYNLGLVLAAALLGTPIDMSGTMAEIMEKRMVVPDLSDIPDDMRELLEAMLQPNPQDRIGSMAEVRDWPLESGSATTSVPPRSGTRSPATGSGSTHGSSAARALSSKRPSQPRPASKTPPRLQTATQRSAKPDAAPGRTGLWIALGALAVIALGAGGGWYYVKSKTSAWDQVQVTKQASPAPSAVDTPQPAPQPQTEPESKASQETPPPAANLALQGTPAEGQVVSGDQGQVAETAPSSQPDATPPAELAPAPVPEQSAPAIKDAAALGSFLASFDGGECFYAWPAEGGNGAAALAVRALGAALPPISALAADLKQRTGTDIPVNAQLVTDAQCPAVSTLRQLMRGRSIVPTLILDSQTVAPGASITGEAYDLRDTHLDLLLVQENGQTYKLTRLIDPRSQRFEFNTGPDHLPQGSAQIPQLLLLVASPEPLQALQDLDEKTPQPASAVLPALAREAESNGAVSAALQYFVLKAPKG